jgi:cytochrome c peroxidase
VWYRLADGVTPDIRYNDLPVSFAFNVNAVDVPFDPASAPSLTDGEINDLVVFICTLIDGFDPTKPAAYLRPGQCQLATTP